MNEPELHIPGGFAAGGISARIKAIGKLDLGMIRCERNAVAALVTTTNLFAAAPVVICRERMEEGGPIRGVIVNSGNANAVTGKRGLRDAVRMAEAAARATGSPAGSFLVASTGIIGKPLPIDRIVKSVPSLAESASPEGFPALAESILTTDTRPKMSSVRIGRSSRAASIIGVAKGVGMLQPKMATMLAFICTDYPLRRGKAQRFLSRATEETFNCVTVDGQTSTNDTAILLSSSMAPTGNMDRAFYEGLLQVCTDLSRAIAFDGEGATKLVTIEVAGARNLSDARQVGLAVANSPLVKTALYGEDPNWGRIAQAMGHSGVAFDPDKVSISMQKIALMKRGLPENVDRAKVKELLKTDRILIEIHLGLKRGASARVWTCDLTHDYIKINTAYN